MPLPVDVARMFCLAVVLAAPNPSFADVRKREQAAETSERDQRKLTHERCDEMYRIIHGRRQKVASMSPGERSDHDWFEATWQARCKSS
jgi:hypothetical protein